MKQYTVSQLARLAGVSVRTLHHYDHIGLLRPSLRSQAGYRLYLEDDLLRLQQVLLYRELDVPLDEIGRMLSRASVHHTDALREHRRRIEQRIARLTRLIGTIDKTVLSLEEDTMPLTDAELYEGFSPAETAQLKQYEAEARTLYDPALVAESQRRVRNLSKEEWNAIKQEGDDVTRRLAGLMDRRVDDPMVQDAIGRHYAWVSHFFPVSAEVYRGLGEGYAAHAGFRATYEKYASGLADFMCAAIAYYCEHTLA